MTIVAATYRGEIPRPIPVPSALEHSTGIAEFGHEKLKRPLEVIVCTVPSRGPHQHIGEPFTLAAWEAMRQRRRRMR